MEGGKAMQKQLQEMLGGGLVFYLSNKKQNQNLSLMI